MLWTKQVLALDRAPTVSFNPGISDTDGILPCGLTSALCTNQSGAQCWLQTLEEFALHDMVNTKLKNTVMEQIRVA